MTWLPWRASGPRATIAAMSFARAGSSSRFASATLIAALLLGGCGGDDKNPEKGAGGSASHGGSNSGAGKSSSQSGSTSTGGKPGSSGKSSAADIARKLGREPHFLI